MDKLKTSFEEAKNIVLNEGYDIEEFPEITINRFIAGHIKEDFNVSKEAVLIRLKNDNLIGNY